MKKIGILVFIFAILFFHAVVNYHILAASRLPRIADETQIIRESITCNFSNIETIKALLYFDNHPPFSKVICALCWWFLNILRSANINTLILLSNYLFLFILLASVYGIGNQFYGARVGILSAFLVSMFPIVFGHSRIILMDLPLTSMTSLTVYLLLKSRHFSSAYYSLLAGIIFGLAELTKEAAVIFVIPPFIYYFLQSISLKERRKTIRNSALFLLSFGIIAGMMYLKMSTRDLFSVYMQKIHIPYHPANYFYCFFNFPTITGPLIFTVSLPLLIGYLINIKRREKLFLYWFLIPFILFSLSPNRSMRFILPLSVAFCLMISQEVFNNALFKKIKLWYISILVIAAVAQYALINSGLLKMHSYSSGEDYFEHGILYVYKDKHYYDYNTVSNSLLDVFKREAGQDGLKNNRNIVFLFLYPEILGSLRTNLLLYRLPFNVFGPEHDYVEAKYCLKTNLEEFGATADYIVDKDGDKPYLPFAKIIVERMYYGFNKSKDEHFKLIATIEFYDASHIYVYKRIQ